MKICIACAEDIKEAALLCKHCGTRQDDPSYISEVSVDEIVSLQNKSENTCLACGTSIAPQIRICEDCDSSLKTPSHCPWCAESIPLKPLKKNITSAIAGRKRVCPHCSYNFFLPSEFARVLKTHNELNLSPIDLEWLFFAAYSYQINQFGGTKPAIDADSDGNWESFFWPNDSQNFDETFALSLLQKYRSSPQLWYESIFSEEDYITIEFDSALSIDQLESEEIRQALVRSIELSSNLEPKFAAIVKSLLNDENVLV